MTRIVRVHAREVLDSRGRPTVEVEVHTDSGAVGAAIVPSGASTGAAEAVELRDGDPARYGGLGVLQAVGNVRRVLGPAVAGLDAADQATIDARLVELDGTPQKSRLGANAILGVSLAAAHAAAKAQGAPLFRHLHALYAAGEKPALLDHRRTPTVCRLPLPMVNMISGGLHAGGNLDFQDFLIQPLGAASYSQGLEWIVRVYRRLGELLSAAGHEGRLVGDEGGYGPRLSGDREACQFIVRAIEAAGLRPGADVTMALDVASTHFFDGSHYVLKAAGGARLTADALIDRLVALVDEFPITSIEDGLAEEDWQGWQRLTARLGSGVRLVGDDLFATNESRLRRGIETAAANSVLIKVNQVGTLSETFAALHAAQRAGFARVVSARSGETEDATIADLAVGVAAEQIKIGSMARSERLAKYNRLLRIEEELGLQS
jgi:enolase